MCAIKSSRLLCIAALAALVSMSVSLTLATYPGTDKASIIPENLLHEERSTVSWNVKPQILAEEQVDREIDALIVAIESIGEPKNSRTKQEASAKDNEWNQIPRDTRDLVRSFMQAAHSVLPKQVFRNARLNPGDTYLCADLREQLKVFMTHSRKVLRDFMRIENDTQAKECVLAIAGGLARKVRSEPVGAADKRYVNMAVERTIEKLLRAPVQEKEKTTLERTLQHEDTRRSIRQQVIDGLVMSRTKTPGVIYTQSDGSWFVSRRWLPVSAKVRMIRLSYSLSYLGMILNSLESAGALSESLIRNHIERAEQEYESATLAGAR